jgi:hypothetical protein
VPTECALGSSQIQQGVNPAAARKPVSYIFLTKRPPQDQCAHKTHDFT